MAIDLSTTDMMDSVSADHPSSSALEDLAKKVRKPYTITKSRESWTEQEHDKFLEALQLFDRDWKKIEAFVGSKTVIQIRSHAQKYFLKVQKNGTGEHVPPPRPKRKSAQPYPHKAAKTVLTTHQMPSSISQTQQAAPAPGSAPSMTTAWVHHMAPPANSTFIKKNGLSTAGLVPSKAQVDHSKEVSSMPHHQLVLGHASSDIVLRAMPDFTEVYSFLGSVFDPSTNGHLEKMLEMAPIDRETVLVLMRNLSINLSNADFEEHKLFLSVYDMDMDIGDTLHDLGSDAKCQTDTPQVKETFHETKQEQNE